MPEDFFGQRCQQVAQNLLILRNPDVIVWVGDGILLVTVALSDEEFRRGCGRRLDEARSLSPFDGRRNLRSPRLIVAPSELLGYRDEGKSQRDWR